MSDVKVYGLAGSPYVAAVLVCLEEAGAGYELVPVDFVAREQRAPQHLARNPFGKVPVLEDGELTLFESRAISRYVLRKYKSTGSVDLLREDDLEEAAMVDLWMEVEAHHYQDAIRNIVRQCVILPKFGGARDQSIVDENVEKLSKILEVYEERLSKSAYLAGDFVSLVDLSHFPFTHYFMSTEYASLIESRTNVKAWWERLLTRSSVKKVAALMPMDFGIKPPSA